MSDIFKKAGARANLFAPPAEKSIQNTTQDSIQENTQMSTQESIQSSVQKNIQESLQKNTQESVQICIQLKGYLREKIDQDLQRKIKYIPASIRVEEDVGQALQALAKNKDLPHGIQQAVANNALRIALEALGYLPRK